MGIINIAHAGVISDAPSLTKVGFNVLSFLLSVFGVIAIIMMVVYGIIYLTAAGDQKQMQKGKKGFTYAIVGLILTFSCMAIVYQLGKFF